jgi:hypothetical protein
MIQTLADQYPEAHQQLKKLGFPCISRMMFHFTRQAAMDAALGYGPGACSNWFRLKSSPSLVSESRAKEWLEKNQGDQPEPVSEPEEGKPEQETAACKPDPELKKELLLMVSGRPDRLRKLVQIAEFMELKVIVISDEVH